MTPIRGLPVGLGHCPVGPFGGVEATKSDLVLTAGSESHLDKWVLEGIDGEDAHQFFLLV